MEAPHEDAGTSATNEYEVVEPTGDHTTTGDDSIGHEVGTTSLKESSFGVGKAITIKDGVHGDEHKCKDAVNESVGVDDDVPRVGMAFTSYDEVCNFYKRYALSVGFGVAVRKSQFAKSGVCRRLILACSKGGKGRENACYQARRTAKTDCQASVVVKLWSDGLLHLMEAHLDHNHPVNPSSVRLLRCYKKMGGVVAGDFNVQPSGPGSLHSEEKECAKFTEIEGLELGEGDDEAIYQFFASMQNKNPNFFYSVDLDKHGRLKNLFWADARSRAAYQCFGDVVWFDTACVNEKYDVPLALFVGVNHHGQLVSFGCGLLSDETVETYIWLFKAWLICMLGCSPNAIICDHCEAIQEAVSKVLPGARYRICLSHIMKKVPEKLRGFAEFKEFKKSLKKTVYDSVRVEDFEKNWKKMIDENRLEDNEWLCSLYHNRHFWVPVFVKDTFWAGLSISQRGESTSAFFEGSLYPRTTVKQFLSKYEMILQTKYKKEAQADSDSFHKTPLSVSKFFMEEQLSKLYTLNMFRKFQEELKATMYCHVIPIKADGSILTFEVKECSYMEDGKRTETKDHEVLYNANEVAVQCICGYFQFWGILCRHALSVFKLQQIFEIPSHYILDRWRKDFKRLHALAHSPTGEPQGNAMKRHEYLTMRCLQLVGIGFISEDRYQLALKLIREAEKSLIDDTTSRESQPMILSFENQSIDNVEIQNGLVSQLGFPDNNKNSNSLQVKHRNRPHKKAREASLETFVRSNKEQDFLSSPLVGDENSMIQSATTASLLDPHIGMQGSINLMEDPDTNDLSFDTQFALHVNHPHHIGDQTRMLSSNLLQGEYDQQPIGNQSRIQWIYHHMLQEDPMTKASSGPSTG